MPSKCKHSGCDKQPTYAKQPGDPARYCAEHGLVNGCEVNVVKKKCEHDGCDKQPSYAKQLGDPARFCAEHGKVHGCTTDVVHKKCEHPGCDKNPGYAKQLGDPARFCAEHGKAHGCTVEVKNKKCEHLGCNKQPSYAKQPGDPARFCAEHGKAHGCINVISKKCEQEGCDKNPGYAKQPGDPARFCAEHGKVHGCEVDVTSPRCKSLHCSTFVSGKYNGYCLFCFAQLFPDEPRAKNYKRKQRVIEEIIKARVNHPDTRYDKTFGACSKRRPDVLFECFTHVVIIEIDEGQHKNYDLPCEENRIGEIYEDVACRPIHLIRFNPDAYTNALGKSVPGCFHDPGRKGVTVVRDGKPLNARLEVLFATLERCLKHPPENNAVQTHMLFFNRFVAPEVKRSAGKKRKAQK
jgi:hypothetical protein